MIKLENVTKIYPDGTKAVDDVNLEVDEGEICIFLGPSGCGKTTTMKMINRLIPITSGMIYINGEDNTKIKASDLRRGIGYAIQEIGLFTHMTVGQNIETVPVLKGWNKEKRRARVEELLELVRLNPAEYYAKYPAEISGGQRQRVGVARALGADPPILLMDEPFGAIDPINRVELQTEFLKIQQKIKKTIIFVTHDIYEAIKMGDRIALMKDEKLVQYDTSANILYHPKDEFVEGFVGADRALKRLSRIPVTTLTRPATSVTRGTVLSEKDLKKLPKYVWAVDSDNRLLGWADTAGGQDTALWQVDESQCRQISVLESASLREALSHMLGQGIRNVPIVADDGRLVGQVTLKDIEETTAE